MVLGNCLVVCVFWDRGPPIRKNVRRKLFGEAPAAGESMGISLRDIQICSLKNMPVVIEARAWDVRIQSILLQPTA